MREAGDGNFCSHGNTVSDRGGMVTSMPNCPMQVYCIGRQSNQATAASQTSTYYG
jgi:hypothetical protein